jgi:homocysteine S-methyltransferase
MSADPTEPFLKGDGTLILDGGLATTLEANGHALDGALWSARLLSEAPEAIRAVHEAFLAAGADCIIAASYQASVQGFMDYGLSEAEGVELLQRSVGIAREARDAFWAEDGSDLRHRPLVAASIGPLGATRSDGSEYRGDYGLSLQALIEFHRPRWQVLAAAGPDLLACETIPSVLEAEALLAVLAESPEVPAWISFSCRDGEHLCDGTPMAEAAAQCDSAPGLVALGINCTSPEHIDGLIARARRGTDLPIVVYPNAGGCYDADAQQWSDAVDTIDWGTTAPRWRRAGACLIGGCCGVGPASIRALHRAVRPGSAPG